MTKQELLNKRAALIAEIDGANEKRFAEIKAELAKVDYQIELCESDEQRAAKTNADDEQRAPATRPPLPPTTARTSAASRLSRTTETPPQRALQRLK